jgi:hypothetical protein
MRAKEQREPLLSPGLAPPRDEPLDEIALVRSVVGGVAREEHDRPVDRESERTE